KKVTVYLTDVTVWQVLDELLKGTGLKAVLPFSRDVLVIKKKQLEVKIRQETITGTVTDAQTGEPLVGVNILVAGTSNGTATDANGHYELTVESLQDTLRFSFIGYRTKEVAINGRTTINVSLQSQAITGEELVVVGYGVQQKQDLTGAVSSVS